MTSTRGERFARASKHDYWGRNVRGTRAAGASFGVLTTTGRASKADLQEVADSMATITETATVGPRDGNAYLVTFTVTHRVLPIERGAA